VAAVAADRHRVTAAGAVPAAVASVVTTISVPAEETAVAAMAARTGAAGNGMAAVRAGAPVAAMAEIYRFGAAAQGHHENNTVHFGNLQEQRSQPKQNYE